MKKKTCILKSMLLSVFAFGSVNAQDVKITVDKNHNNEYVFSATKVSDYPYTAFITFTTLRNYKGPYMENEAIPVVLKHEFNDNILRLKPLSPNINVRYAYTIRTLIGDYKSKPDTNFVYMPPVKPGVKVKSVPIGRISAKMGISNESKIGGCSFMTSRGDTVYASRAGYIVEVSLRNGEDKKVKINNIDIYHIDGSVSSYSTVAAIELLHKVGGTVMAGQPIAVITETDELIDTRLKMDIKGIFVTNKEDVYNGRDDKDKNPDVAVNKVVEARVKKRAEIIEKNKAFTNKSWRYFNPVIYQSENNASRIEKTTTFMVEHPVELITQEMGKKEKKKYLKENQ